MFKSETVQTSKTGRRMRSRAILGLAAAAGLSAAALAGQASATTTFNITNVSMDTTYEANIVGFGAAYDNGVTFSVSGYPTGETSLYGFCIDIYHDIYLGGSYTYSTNQPQGGGLVANSGTTLNATQVSAITDLVDTGFLLHQQNPNDADTSLKLAAIQAAIWEIEVPTTNNQQTVTLVNPNATVAGDPTPIETYFENYVNGNYDHSLLTPQDKVFTIANGTNQSFAIGWPISGGVPEPATWAMLLTGFFGMGSLLRRHRKAAVTA